LSFFLQMGVHVNIDRMNDRFSKARI